jgi:ankyrin repeat protein
VGIRANTHHPPKTPASCIRTGSLIVGILLIAISLKTPVTQLNIFLSPEALFMKAAEEGNIALGQKALEKGIDVNAQLPYWSDERCTALLIATMNGNIPVIGKENRDDIHQNYVKFVTWLLERGADVNATTSSGITPLMKAVGNTTLLTVLLQYHADTTLVDEDGMTALGYAVRRSRYRPAMLLSQQGGNLAFTTNNGDSLLHLAAEGGGVELVQYFLDAGLEPNSRNSQGATPLMLAVNSRHDVVRLLLEHGADPNIPARGVSGETTALMKAALWGNVETARMLLKHDADVTGEIGQRVLQTTLYGTGHCSTEFLQLLRQYGVPMDPETRCEEEHNYE